MERISGYNDRCNLFLLLHKEYKSEEDKELLAGIIKHYPDYANIYTGKIKTELWGKGFIERIDTRPDLPDDGEKGNAIKYDFEKWKWITTEKGIKALSVEYFKSEYKQAIEDTERQKLIDKERKINIRNARWALPLSIIAILISAVALIITMILSQQ